MNKQRIVITGMATINPLGDTVEEYYQNLLAGKSGVKKWESLDLAKCENRVGGDLGDYDTKAALERLKEGIGEAKFKKLRKLFRSATFSSKTAVLTSQNAWLDAGLEGVEIDPYITMVVVAGHNLNSKYINRLSKQYEEEPEYMDPLSSVEAIDNNVPALISEVLKVHGPSYTVGGACASGNLALRDAVRDIRSGEVERAVVTGALFDVAEPDIQASVIINSVVMDKELNEHPETACRPFDTRRNGFVYSHGSAALVVESLESALARGAHIHAEVLSVRANANANHLPMPGAQHQAWVMRKVLEDAGVKPGQVEYANCHATGTPAGDKQEIYALREVFGDHLKEMKINAPKSMLGHTCWASPLVETIGGIMQMNNSRLHPTINVDAQDPEIEADVCADGPVDWEVNYMLKNSFGFGGLNCCSLIKKWEGA
ncbi:beta-ketoacyl-[acyl-carrier-protein] synthase family protein [Salinispira pacifica]|uniref:3-oxoacyl-[acyl-carrier-protein] synthase, KASII n=1 Tax=Salinispira pacifica TaxID=1307761 RepID=V5WF91_9SPIO|nr:beta-ketoacyl-[acyl-carrier-protein] synthase family protein [Salinispira pacifica]AHC13846.1 3-oxoacyl-[acyl-carrier-protein] synthase, KASII [Salinispira pacifica]